MGQQRCEYTYICKDNYLFMWPGKQEVRCDRLEQCLLSFLQIACYTEISPVTIISKGLIGWHCIVTPFSTLYSNHFWSSKSRFIPKHLKAVWWQKIMRNNTDDTGRGRWHWSVTLHMVCLFCIDKLWEVWCAPISEHG